MTKDYIISASLAAVDDIQAELIKAVEKSPSWPTDPLHALAVLSKEYGELTQSVLQLTYEPHKPDSSIQAVRTEALQTAAMALRFVMSLDDYRYGPSEQHQHGAKHASGEANE